MPPFRGWNTWNALGIDALTADAVEGNARVVASVLKPKGYTFVNIDDGFFHGRDDEGNLLVHPDKFPEGMRACLDGIKEMGLKTGIYSDAGRNTCGYYHNHDVHGRGSGLEDHELGDISLFLNSWDCDLLKVDWCGAWMRMNKRNRYTAIGDIVRAVKPSALYSVCCWKWPGDWVTRVADSWRVGPDLQPAFSSIVDAISHTKDLWQHASSRRFNDLDIMQLGHGMSDAEERTHFAMWCMLNSPVLLSCDLTSARSDFFDLVSNPTLLRIHDDSAGRQAICTADDGWCSVWKRRLADDSVAVAVMNYSDTRRIATVTCDRHASEALDAWTSAATTVGRSFSLSVAPRDTAVMILSRTAARAEA